MSGEKGSEKVFTVLEPGPLLEFLLERFAGRGRNKVKAMLARGQVRVDGRATTRHDHPLAAGQSVEVRENSTGSSALPGLRILFEDGDLIVVDKPAGILSIATEGEKERTAYRMLTEHVRRRNPQARVFVVHRLDRDTSGVMVFAKREAVQQELQNHWKERVAERTYLAVVEGRPRQMEGTVESWLRENQTLTVVSSRRPGEGRKAVTHYRVLRPGDEYSLLEVRLETGRKNQIRVHMRDLGHCVAGDRRYGAARNPLGRLGLHARSLSFRHPATEEVLRFEAEIPPEFLRLFPRPSNRG